MFSTSRILIHRLRGVCAIRREGGAARRCPADDLGARTDRDVRRMRERIVSALSPITSVLLDHIKASTFGLI